MNCEIIKDLIPLCIDGCCSTESEIIVKEHIEKCASCKKIFEDMKTPTNTISEAKSPLKLNKLNDWKASIMQSVLLFLSIALITTGVALEAATPSGWGNGYWAFNLVIPAMGFMLSLANWYFVKLYKSRDAFAKSSLISTVGLTIIAFIWACFHYEVNLFSIFDGSYSFLDALGILQFCMLFGGLGVIITVILSILSITLSNLYAKMLGKE